MPATELIGASSVATTVVTAGSVEQRFRHLRSGHGTLAPLRGRGHRGANPVRFLETFDRGPKLNATAPEKRLKRRPSHT